MATFGHYISPMKRLQVPDAFKMLPNRIDGAGIEVFLFDSPLVNDDDTSLEFTLHTLVIVLDGSLSVNHDTMTELVHKDEAIMMKKNCSVSMSITSEYKKIFRCLVISFDEPSLKYALLPFELEPANTAPILLKIPLNDKIKVFTDSILLYYQSYKDKNNWATLLQGKLRELLWIFFHTSVKEKAKEFFSAG